MTTVETTEALRAVLTMAHSVREQVLQSLPSGTYAVVRIRMAGLLGIPDPWRPDVADGRLDVIADWPTSPLFSAADRAALTMAEQFLLDVSAVDDAQRADLHRELGDGSVVLVNALYAIDAELRLRAVTSQLFGSDLLAPLAPQLDVEMRDALNLVTRRVTVLDAVDPLTTELVRLRVARLHQCRICQSLRHVDALASGGDEDLFDRIDDYERADLSERHRTALRLADAVVNRPGDLPAGLVEQVAEVFTREECLELVLDVERHSRNKVAVTNGTDGDGVGSGVSVYATPDGGFEMVRAAPGTEDPSSRF